jgi:glycosyltransferase involved in cell wall biosynthesis
LLRHPSIEERGFIQNVAEVLSEADILVLPSIEEGSALVTYEARGAGCCLLASDAAGAVGTHGVDVLFHESGNVAQLTEQLRTLNTDSARLAELKRRSLAAAETLTWAYAARVLLNVYRNLVVQRTCVRAETTC